MADVKAAINGFIDEVMTASTKTQHWNANPALVKGFGAAKVGQVGHIVTEGLLDYDRKNGYKRTNGGAEFEDVTLSHDRAASVLIDSRDLADEANLPAAGAFLSTFVKERVVPEIDATRVAEVCKAMAGTGNEHLVTGYSINKSTIYGKIETALDTILDDTGSENANILLSAKAYSALKMSTEFNRSRDVSGQSKELNAGIATIDGNPLYVCPQSRMKTELEYYTGNEAEGVDITNGWAPKGTAAGSVTASDVIAVISVPDSIQGIIAHKVSNIIGADDNQGADGSLVNFRVYHDAYVPANKKKGVVVITA